MDSKKSPLALLAQTCSAIGADSNTTKPLISPASANNNVASIDKSKKSVDTLKSQATANGSSNNLTCKPDKPNDLSFKPYELNVLSRKSSDNDSVHRPQSKTSSVDENLSDESNKSNFKKDSRVSSRNSNRESPISAGVNGSINNNNNNHIDSKSDINDNDKSLSENNKSPGLSSQKDSSPPNPARSSAELVQQHHKDLGLYKQAAAAAAGGFNPFYPPGIDPMNPAFRSGFPGAAAAALSPHHASLMAAAAAGYPTNSSNPYLSYARIKTPTGEALVPVCKDPYCQGCQYSAHNQQMLLGVPCPPGCTQCDQQKYGLAMAMSSLPPNHPFAQMSKPFACNWIMTDGYCGRRFSTTDELIQHMKTHSPNLSDPATAASILAAQQSASLMAPYLFPGLPRSPGAAAAAAGYPSTSPLSPLSAARYHPYGKPGSIPSTYSSFNPALSAYYPPYSWMPRVGTAAHP